MANKAWQITPPGTISLNDAGPIPKPGPKQALVRIHAASFNYRDILVIDHNPAYPMKHKPNLTPGIDGAGTVEERGEGSIWKKGDAVIIQANSWKKGNDDRDFDLEKTLGGGQCDGTFRQWMLVEDDDIFKAPKGLSMEEASTIYCAGVTAYRALFYAGRTLKPGMTVLTQGTGGVSCWAIMIAAAAGAKVIATSSSDDKLEIAKKLGATHLINYRKTPDWASEALKSTDGKGVDIVVEVVGAEGIEQSLKALSYGGLVSMVGMLSEDPGKPVNIAPGILFGAKTVRGQLGAGSKEVAEEFVEFIERHQLHPPIAQTFAFEEADKAIEALKKLSGVGKVVMRC